MTWKQFFIRFSITMLVVIALIILMGCDSRRENCEVAKMEVNFYESCMRDINCDITDDERRYLVWAKTAVIRFCDEN